MKNNTSIEFFETQFQRQTREQDYALNPFEALALNYLSGSVLDLGCGLGNLSLEAARRGHPVVAIDASPTAIARIKQESMRQGLAVDAILAHLDESLLQRSFDTIVAIGIIPFFPREASLILLNKLKEQVNPGGHAIVNVLLQGTTYLELFQADHYHLFDAEEFLQHFDDWLILEACRHEFAAPGNTCKQLFTIVAQKLGETETPLRSSR